MAWENRADRLSLLLGVFVAGYITCMAGNHVSQLWSEHGTLQVMQKKVVPALVAQRNCEKRRAENNEHVAEKAILGAVSDTAPIPSTDEIQTDCPKNITAGKK